MIHIKLISNSIARSYGVAKDKMPTFRHKGYTPAVVNSEAFIARIREALPKADFVNKVFNDFQVTGLDDAAALIEGLDGVQGAYLMVGTAAPKIFAEARAQGKFFPFTPHEPDYQVDLDAIPYGTKVAALLALEVLSR